MLFYRLSTCVAMIVGLAALQSSEAAAVNKGSDALYKCASNNERSDKIKQSFLLAYNGYRKYAWGHDELLPLSKGFSDSRNKWGASIVDALDTMIIMGLDKEYEEALQFVSKIDFSKSSEPSKGFETNIRYLGGLLSANDLRPNRILVQKAVEVTEKTLIPLFVESTSLGTKVKVPLAYMDLNTKKPLTTKSINLAEFGTYTMEFTRLSQITGNPKYEKLANDLVNAAIEHNTRMPGLFPTSWTVKPFAPINTSTITVGGGGDSFYEYLIKNYILQTNRNEDHKKIWEDSVESIEKYMLSPTKENPDIKFVAMIGDKSVYYSSQELICYMPGNILLGLPQIEDEEKKKKFRNFADVFFKSCIETWKKTSTTIAPESWSWNPKDNALQAKLDKLVKDQSGSVKPAGKKTSAKEKRAAAKSFRVDNSIYDLRPETIESVFYYYRLTGNPAYQDLAWRLFRGIDKFARVESGYTRVDNVDQDLNGKPIQLQDFQESFFFAETLKYLYLTFVDKDCISLNDYVFNTEAHPFKLPQPIDFQ